MTALLGRNCRHGRPGFILRVVHSPERRHGVASGRNAGVSGGGLPNPLPSGERVARRAGEGDLHVGASGTSATPSP
ncbi:hypothetical protein GAY33_26565 [Azospirillum brasilense]|uniref:Uncharacterized protein n=1 Tax=Azospirillum argentinense TaxID=2970906 RepID=A0A5B0L026_9PROT|nr:hypothetical protein FH063_001833 [Azospirillum argentinense]MBK3802727.1 hypothetical protein [Azospirillum argentinense]